MADWPFDIFCKECRDVEGLDRSGPSILDTPHMLEVVWRLQCSLPLRSRHHQRCGLHLRGFGVGMHQSRDWLAGWGFRCFLLDEVEEGS